MPRLEWDKTGERLYETGVSHGVLYPLDAQGAYSSGVVWNGLTSVSESPEGAEPTDIWADDMMILHGTADTTVPIEDSRAFAENNVITFVPVEGADHPFRDPKLMDFAIHTIIEFFAPEG